MRSGPYDSSGGEADARLHDPGHAVPVRGHALPPEAADVQLERLGQAAAQTGREVELETVSRHPAEVPSRLGLARSSQRDGAARSAGLLQPDVEPAAALTDEREGFRCGDDLHLRRLYGACPRPPSFPVWSRPGGSRRPSRRGRRRTPGGPDEIRPLQGDAEVDVAIVGGGYTGLWTALALRERDPSLRVAVLEKEIVGWGPSGRNGGFLHGYWSQLARLRPLLGAEAALELCRRLRPRDPRRSSILRDARRGRLAA